MKYEEKGDRTVEVESPTNLLLRNKKSVDKAILLVAEKDFQFTELVTIKRLERDIDSFIRQGNYTDAIDNLNQLRDAKRGITWSLYSGNVLVRDARNINDFPKDKHIAYIIQFLNLARASQTLCEGDNDKELIQAFMQEMNNVQDVTSDKESLSILTSFNTRLTLNLQERLNKIEENESSFKEVGERLNSAKDYVGLQDTHRHIVTLGTVTHNDNKRTTYKSSTLITALTLEQRGEYEFIRAIRDKGLYYEDWPKWFVALSEVEKQLLLRHIDAILDGLHGIPTQLRKILGARNAYCQRTGYIDDNELNQRTETFHSAAVASLSKNIDERQRIANSNIAQLQQEMWPSVRAHLVTLNSDLNATGDDPEIVKQAAIGAETKRALHDNRGLNIVGQSSYNIDNGTNFLIEKLISSMLDKNEQTKVICEYLGDLNNNSESAQAALKQFLLDKKHLLEAEPNLEQEICAIDTIIMLNAAISLKQNMALQASKSQLFSVLVNQVSGGENINLTINAALFILLNKLQHGRIDPKIINPEDLKELQTILIFQCASGKDRTQLQLMHNNLMCELLERAISENDFKDLTADMLNFSQFDQKFIEETILDQAFDDHSQLLASINCGTPGCSGLKEDTKNAAPLTYGRATKILFEKSASGNKFKPLDPQTLQAQDNTRAYNVASKVTSIAGRAAYSFGSSLIGGVASRLFAAPPSPMESREKMIESNLLKLQNKINIAYGNDKVRLNDSNYLVELEGEVRQLSTLAIEYLTGTKGFSTGGVSASIPYEWFISNNIDQTGKYPITDGEFTKTTERILHLLFEKNYIQIAQQPRIESKAGIENVNPEGVLQLNEIRRDEILQYRTLQPFQANSFIDLVKQRVHPSKALQLINEPFLKRYYSLNPTQTSVLFSMLQRNLDMRVCQAIEDIESLNQTQTKILALSFADDLGQQKINQMMQVTERYNMNPTKAKLFYDALMSLSTNERGNKDVTDVMSFEQALSHADKVFQLSKVQQQALCEGFALKSVENDLISIYEDVFASMVTNQENSGRDFFRTDKFFSVGFLNEEVINEENILEISQKLWPEVMDEQSLWNHVIQQDKIITDKLVRTQLEIMKNKNTTEFAQKEAEKFIRGTNPLPVEYEFKSASRVLMGVLKAKFAALYEGIDDTQEFVSYDQVVTLLRDKNAGHKFPTRLARASSASSDVAVSSSSIVAHVEAAPIRAISSKEVSPILNDLETLNALTAHPSDDAQKQFRMKQVEIDRVVEAVTLEKNPGSLFGDLVKNDQELFQTLKNAEIQLLKEFMDNGNLDSQKTRSCGEGVLDKSLKNKGSVAKGVGVSK